MWVDRCRWTRACISRAPSSWLRCHNARRRKSCCTTCTTPPRPVSCRCTSPADTTPPLHREMPRSASQARSEEMSSNATTRFRRSTVDVRSGDSYCTAWLYLPESSSDAPVPVVVMGHGLGATRELGLAPYAERFAATGLAVLVFTYRHLGDSGGAPRQVLSMAEQLADWDA